MSGSTKNRCRNCPEELTCTLVFASIAALLGILQFGYNIGVINTAQDSMQNFIQNVTKSRTNATLSNNKLAVVWSFIVSFYDVGGMIGGLISPLVISYLGRKNAVLMINTIGITGSLLATFSMLMSSYEIIVLGRFFIGCHCGLNSVLVPMYISEISPRTLRGGFGTLTHIGASVGLLLTFFCGSPFIFGTSEKWPYLFVLNLTISILQLIILPFCPDSPRFLLISRDKECAARSALERLRGTTQVNDEFEEMKAEKTALEQETQLGIFQILRKKHFRGPLSVSIFMQLSVIFSGMIIFFNYSKKLFILAGLPGRHAQTATTILGFIMLLMSFVSIPLMDRAGRRTLHLFGLGGMFFSGALFTTFLPLYSRWKNESLPYIAIISAYFFVTFFSIGPASIPFLIVAELFTQKSRAAGMSIAMFTNWFLKIFIGLSFPYLYHWLENYIMLPYTVSTFFFWVYTYFKVPETKNKTFVEIQAFFKNRDHAYEAQ